MTDNKNSAVTVELGGVYRFAKKSEFKRVKAVEVIDIFKDGTVEVEFGVYKDNDFIAQPVGDAKGKEVRRAIVVAEALVERLDNSTGVAMAEERTVVPTDDAGNELPEGGKEKKKQLTPEEKAAAVLKAENEKLEAKQKKQEALAKEIATKRSDKLKEQMQGLPVTEAEIAKAASEGAEGGPFETFFELNAEQAKNAYAALKELKKASEKAEKVRGKLAVQAEKAGVVEADIAKEYSNGRVEVFAELTEEEVEAAFSGISDKVKQAAKDEALLKRTTLSADELKERENLEKIVFKFLPTFSTAAMQIGGALNGINQHKLYRSSHKTFQEYVEDVFNLSRPHAYTVMAAAETFNALTDGAIVDAKNLPSIRAAEAITSGVKGLLKEANLQDDAEVTALTRSIARNVYQLAVQDAPVGSDGKPILSAGHIASVFSVLNEVARSGVVEVDGKQVPVNLAAATIDEMITTESKERSERAKAGLVARFEQAKEQAAATAKAQSARLSDAIDSATGNGQEIPDGVVPKLHVICSVHGKNALESSSDADVILGCGCVFLSTPEGYLFEKNKNQPNWKKEKAVAAS